VNPYLAICAVYRDEAPYLREWIEFHRLVGVERFYLFNNLSVDNHREVLAPYVEAGIVALTDWPVRPAQIQCYDQCLKDYRDEARWIAFIDLDEFLFSPTERPVAEILEEFEQWPGVGANWAVFGSAGHATPPAGLVIESYTRRTGDDAINCHIKSIVDPRRVRAFCMPHFFIYTDGTAVDENKRPITGPPYALTDRVSLSRLRVNHYATKSEEEYRRKLARGPADSTVPKSELMTEANIARRLEKLDEVTDEEILVYLPSLRAALASPRNSRSSQITSPPTEPFWPSRMS
jgi:Glycosyltransferase family 92